MQFENCVVFYHNLNGWNKSVCDYFICIFPEVDALIVTVKNIQEITFIRLKTWYTKKNKSFIEMLISIYSYDVKY